MSCPAPVDPERRNPLALYRPEPEESHRGHWRINGYLATLHVWTDEEYRRLAENRPRDAQYFPCGVWCALRIDEEAR
jgi:hypothetical protein